MELISALGIDLRIFIAQLINFAVLVFVLYKFAYHPVLNLLEERKEKIKKGLENAEASENALAQASAEKQQIIAAANKEAEAMSVRAKEYADEKADAIIAEAQKKAESVTKDAALRSEELKAQALKESEAEIAKLSVLAAEKVLKERTS
jgi:F-type H+-transporting ATPase subunit b